LKEVCFFKAYSQKRYARIIKCFENKIFYRSRKRVRSINGSWGEAVLWG